MVQRLLILLWVLSAAAQADSWAELHPDPDGFDWVQTTSGEWLKGEVMSIYSETLTFDSDNLGIVSIDFEDIAQLYSRERMDISIENGKTLHGIVTIEAGRLVITDGNVSETVQASAIVSMLGSSSGELDRWGIKVSLGFDFRDGNTRQYDITSKANLIRQTTSSRFILDYIGTLTVLDYNTTTSNSERVNSTLDFFQTRHFYWQPVYLEYFSDIYQNIRSRTTYGAGAGYDIIHTGQTSWSLSGGPAVQSVEYVDVLPDEEKRIISPVFMLQSRYDHELRKNVDFIFNYSMYLLNEKSGKYTHHMIATVETEFINDFTVDLSCIWDRVEKPTVREDGSVPYRNDSRLVVGIGYSY